MTSPNLNGWKPSRPASAQARPLPLPRNSQALLDYRRQGLIREYDGVVVSFVGKTAIESPHVFVDSGRRYDWRPVAGLNVCIALAAGVDARHAMVDLYRQAANGWQPSIVDFDGKHVAWVVSDKPLTLLPHGRGSATWAGLFS